MGLGLRATEIPKPTHQPHEQRQLQRQPQPHRQHLSPNPRRQSHFQTPEPRLSPNPRIRVVPASSTFSPPSQRPLRSFPRDRGTLLGAPLSQGQQRPPSANGKSIDDKDGDKKPAAIDYSNVQTYPSRKERQRIDYSNVQTTTTTGRTSRRTPKGRSRVSRNDRWTNGE